MTGSLRSRRDAEELHAALTGEAGPSVTARHAELVRTVALLTDRPAIRPRVDFSTDLRDRLLLAARTELVPATDPVRRLPAAPTPARRRLGTLAASLALVGGVSGMGVAAAGALPGDPLYPLKRGGEQLALVLEPGTAAQGRAHLGHAEERLDEALRLQRGGADEALVVRSVEEFRELADLGARDLLRDFQAGADPDSVATVHDFGVSQQPRLDQLDTRDPAVQGAALSALDTLQALVRQARTLCESCGTAAALPATTELAEAAGAPTIEMLLVRPAVQARLDAQTLAGLDAAQVRALGRVAERQARETPPLPGGGDWPVTPSTPRSPVSSTLSTTTDGLDRPVRRATDAVDGLVRGLGDGVTRTTDELPGATGPLEEPVRSVTETLDAAVEGVSGVTGGLAGD